MEKNLVLNEEQFVEFQQFCRDKGFDLSYYSDEISGSRSYIENHQFESPRVIKLRKSGFSYRGIPYGVAEWQKADWARRFSRIRDEFFSGSGV
jgi:hypothetical protein